MNIWILDNFLIKIKNNRIRFDDVLKRKNEFLNKLSEIKMGKKTTEH